MFTIASAIMSCVFYGSNNINGDPILAWSITPNYDFNGAHNGIPSNTDRQWQRMIKPKFDFKFNCSSKRKRSNCVRI